MCNATNGSGDNSDRQPGDRQITVAGARRILGLIGRNYNAEQIAGILDALYGIAELAYEDYRERDDLGGDSRSQ